MTVRKSFWFYIIAFIAMLGFANYAVGAEKPTIAVFDFSVSETVTGEITVQTRSGAGRVSVKRDDKTSLLTEKLVNALNKYKKVSVV